MAREGVLVVLATNILVSALLSPFGAPARVLDLVVAGEAGLACDDRVLTEYREVLSRPRFSFAASDVAALLTFFEHEAEHVVAAPLAVQLPVPHDLMFLEVAVAAGAILVTGNQRHYPEVKRGEVRIVSPADFLVWWLD